MEKGSVEGERAGWGQQGKEVAEEWEREVETPGTEEGTGPKGSQAEWGDRGRGSQTTTGKATGSEEKWGKEEGRGKRARWRCRVWGQEAKEAAGRAGAESRRSDRVAQEEKEVEEWSGDPAGKETERKRVRESWRKAMGWAEGRKSARCPPGPTCSATSRTDWTLVPYRWLLYWPASMNLCA